jgi:hypothetical protein
LPYINKIGFEIEENLADTTVKRAVLGLMYFTRLVANCPTKDNKP